MTRRQSYFARQKLIGLGMMIFAVVMALWTKDGTASVLIFPLGLVAFTTKKMVIMDSYYFEMKEKRELKRREMRRAYR